MQNHEHITELLKGVEAWNVYREEKRRSGDTFFRPELERTDLSNVLRSSGEYSDFGLLPPAGIDLSGANLVHSTLNLADLSNADFRGADLRGAKFIGSNLNKANFFNAKLRGTDLSKASLAGTKFARSLRDEQATKPWEALLFPKQNSPEPLPGERKPIRKTTDLLEEVKRVVKHHRDHSEGEISLYFRGEPKCGWPLRSSVKRLPKKNETGLSGFEDQMLRELISRRPEDFVGSASALDEWGLAQHYRLPTRFLDITRNPLVALYFACEDDKHEHEHEIGRLHIFAVPKKDLVKAFNSDAISIITNLAKLKKSEQDLLMCKQGGEYDDFLLARLRLYQGIQQEKPYFDDRIDIRDLYRVFVVEPKQSSERIRAQSGAFLVSAYHDDLDRDAVMKLNPQNPPLIYAHYKLEIPKDCKLDIMNELRLLNVTTETLIPGLDSSSNAIEAKYRHESEKESDEPPPHWLKAWINKMCRTISR